MDLLDPRAALEAIMGNATFNSDPPPLPAYDTTSTPRLWALLSDSHFALLLTFVIYWVVSLTFHWFDHQGVFAQYRIHTEDEDVQRNLVTRSESVRGVLLNQLLQTLWGIVEDILLGSEPAGGDLYHVASWATTIRRAERGIPGLLSAFGFDALTMASRLAESHPSIAGVLAGGRVPGRTPTFAKWEIDAAEFLYGYGVPALRFLVAASIADAWLYFGHRYIHMNKFIYKHVHSQHHRLTVPYTWGAAYVHPFEFMFLNNTCIVLGANLGGLTTRQGMWFVNLSMLKDLYDHCGYVVPWLPIRCDANYHDLHHQPWGIKTNFSMYSSFWDRVCGTLWTDRTAARILYERNRAWAKFEAENKKKRALSSVVQPSRPLQEMEKIAEKVGPK